MHNGNSELRERRKSFLLRIPAELWREIEQWAATDMRSANAQVEFLLRQALLRYKERGKGP
jgi:hypothetical protein